MGNWSCAAGCAAGRAAAAAVTLALLGGCTQFAVRADWNAEPTWAALAPVYYQVDASGLAENCGLELRLGERLLGCARRNYWIGACLVFTGPDPGPWLLEHERKHCAGYDHGSTLAHADP